MYDKTPESPTITNQPETIDQALFAEMAKTNIPACLPNMIPDAVKAWKELNEPYNIARETPRLVSLQGKEKENSVRWVCPYNERLIYTYRKFIALASKDQRIVLTGIRDRKVWYRGDDIDFYIEVVNETLNMREIGLDDYREQTRLAARQAIKEMV